MNEFKLYDMNNTLVSLSNFNCDFLVVYFYPKDNTKGCTLEAHEFSELYNEFKKLNTEIIGISRDSVVSHCKFIEKNNIPYTLLSDPDSNVHKQFDLMKLKKLYGKEYMGVERSTFIFNNKLKLIKEFRNIKANGHAQEVLDYIKNLQQNTI